MGVVIEGCMYAAFVVVLGYNIYTSVGMGKGCYGSPLSPSESLGLLASASA